MYSTLSLVQKFLKYQVTAANGKGHGVHSPFVFQFITKVLNDKRTPPVFENIEALRRQLKQDERILNIVDHGAGSTVIRSSQRKVSGIARTSLKPARFGRLMHRMINYYMATRVVELGTSLGITTSYLASANPLTKVYTFEGADAIADLAQHNFEALGLQNTRLIRGNFDETLEPTLQKMSHVDLAFIDGNHRKEPTLRYFNLLLQKSSEHSIFIFDDIHWSAEMEDAWKTIQSHPDVTLTIDLFFLGIVFFRKEHKIKQHFTIRY